MTCTNRGTIRQANRQAEFQIRRTIVHKDWIPKSVSWADVSCKTTDTCYGSSHWNARALAGSNHSQHESEPQTLSRWAINTDDVVGSDEESPKGHSPGLDGSLGEAPPTHRGEDVDNDDNRDIIVRQSRAASFLQNVRCTQKEWYRHSKETDARWNGSKTRRKKPSDGVVVTNLYSRYASIVSRWVKRQEDRGKLAIIVNPFEGQLFIDVCRDSVVSLCMSTPDDVRQLAAVYDCVLVIGKAEKSHFQSLKRLMEAEKTPHFLVDTGIAEVDQLTHLDLFLDQEIRNLTVERGTSNGWDVGEEVTATISTIPLERYPEGADGLPTPTTVAANWRDVSDCWEGRIRLNANREPTPVHTGDSVPDAWFAPKTLPEEDQMDKFLSMLGYNCNGIRSSWRKDDWRQILQEQPEVVGVCEAKCPLWKLKRYAGGSAWSFFRSIYKYQYIFSAKEPIEGMHGTYLFCKNKPDGWIRGMGGESNSEWDNEGRVCGAIFGRRVVLCTYAKSPKPGLSNLKSVSAFWKAYTEFVQSLLGKGYKIQGFGDLNLITSQTLDVAYNSLYTTEHGVTRKPGCSPDEMRLIKNFFHQTKLVDFFRKNNIGKTAYTYFQTPRDRRK